MAGKLDGKKVAILVADGFEQVEMTKPREALDAAGAETKIVSLKSGQIQGMNHMERGDKFDVDLTLDDARPEAFDALMIPGGLYNPDALRSNEDALEFARQFFKAGKPVAVHAFGFGGDDRGRDRRFVARIDAAGEQRAARQRLDIGKAEMNAVAGLAHVATSAPSR